MSLFLGYKVLVATVNMLDGAALDRLMTVYETHMVLHTEIEWHKEQL